MMTMCESRCVPTRIWEAMLRSGIKFEEYISAALASFKYGDFLAKGDHSGVLITPGSGLVSSRTLTTIPLILSVPLRWGFERTTGLQPNLDRRI